MEVLARRARQAGGTDGEGRDRRGLGAPPHGALRALPVAPLVVAAALLWPARAAAQGAGPDPVGAPGSLRALGPGEWLVEALPCVIEQPGHYVLEQDLRVPLPIQPGAEFGIVIRADHVDLDLGGHELVGGEGSTQGILALPQPKPPARRTDCSNVRIRNGTVRNWTAFGLDLALAREVRLADLYVAHNGLPKTASGGGVIGSGAVVERCAFRLNAPMGLVAGPGAMVSDSQFSGNTGHGLVVTELAVVRGCSALQNGGDGLTLDGPGGTLSDCTAGRNGLAGLRVARGTRVRDCTAWGNDRAGLVVADACSVSGCLLADNGTDGLAVLGDRNRIEDNHAAGNMLGLDVTGRGNLLVGNSLAANSRDLLVGPGNTSGALYEAPPLDVILGRHAAGGSPAAEAPALPANGNVVH
jgi:hypothetical protein